MPRLRFPEFRDAGEWEEKKLGELAAVVRGGSPRPIDNYITTEDDGLNWLKIGDIDKETKYVTNTEQKVRIEALTKTREVYSGDLILSNSMSFGRPYIMKIRSCIHDGWIALTEIRGEVEKEYLYYFIFSPVSQSYFLENAAGSGVLNLNAEIIRGLGVTCPAIPEQQCITACLSSLDDLITAEAKKLDALKAHKKGLMQELFPREGETVPRLRFPEFMDAGEWEEKRLGNICTICTGKKDANEGRKDGIYPFFTCADSHIYSNSYSFDCEALLIAGNANVGNTKYYSGKFEAYQRTYVLSNFQEVDSRYLYSYLQANLQKDLTLQVQTSAMSYIKLSMLEDYIIPTPNGINEQQKIASCLSSLDDLITGQARKVEAIKTHKKGLMQQLFPVADTMAG